MEHTASRKRSLMKKIDLGMTNQATQAKQAERMTRMLNASHSNLFKPEAYLFRFEESTKTSTLCLLYPRYALSLEKIITYHR